MSCFKWLRIYESHICMYVYIYMIYIYTYIYVLFTYFAPKTVTLALCKIDTKLVSERKSKGSNLFTENCCHHLP